jgi:copper homeostasis protein
MTILIEACVDSLQGAVVAAQAGADRLELNSALELDGLTPSMGLVDQVMAAVSIPVITMCRPRSGDFCYSACEWRVMMADAAALADRGIAGIAFGCLNADHQIDRQRIEEMRARFSSITLVFHKAFDAILDPINGATQLANLGINRLMTSGRCRCSYEGAAQIRAIVSAAQGRIEVIPAGGVTSANAADIVAQTGVDQLHGSFSGGKPQEFMRMGNEIRQTIAALAKI